MAAGISVAAVAIPVAVAYAQLAGFNPVYGLYSSILPLVAYAVFGTSRQLIVNPDAATCALVAAAVAPLAGSDSDLYLSLSVTLTFLSGLLCIGASFLRLGALADFLSRPILVGFLNGIALSIFVGQLGKVLGISARGNGIVSQLLGIFETLPQAHLLTVGISFASLALLFLLLHFLPRLPGALVVLAAAAAAVALFKLEQRGVAVLGHIPAGLPPFRLPRIPLDDVPSLVGEASGLALVLFSSGALTARSFATRNRYAIDIDREFAAFGAANIASALSQGFAVTGADSRTAMADAAGGRTQMTGIAAAVMISLVLMFFTEPLQYVPNAALGAVLIFAAFSLFDLRSIRELWNVDRLDMSLAVATMLAVVAVGAIHGILVAVGLALCRFVHKTARPRDEVLGEVDGLPGFHSIDRHPAAKSLPGLALFRFNAPLTFFNADYFKQRALRAANQAGMDLEWFVIDAIPISDIDTDGLYALRDLNQTLAQRGVTMIIAGRRTEGELVDREAHFILFLVPSSQSRLQHLCSVQRGKTSTLVISSFTDFALPGNRGKDSNHASHLGQCQRWRMTLSSKNSDLCGAIISWLHRTHWIPNMNIERCFFIVVRRLKSSRERRAFTSRLLKLCDRCRNDQSL